MRLLRTTNYQNLTARGYELNCNPEKFKYFLGTETGKINGIERRSTFDMLDAIPLIGGYVSPDIENDIMRKICHKFGYSLDYFLLQNSKINSKARVLYAKICYRHGKPIKEIATDLGLQKCSMYTKPFELKKYQCLKTNCK